MSIELALRALPKSFATGDGSKLQIRPLKSTDETLLLTFFKALPTGDLMFFKHRVTNPEVLKGWCENLDLGKTLPLLALEEGAIVAVATLHQKLGGWKRHIGRISVSVLPAHRKKGIAAKLVHDLVEVAQMSGLRRLEAEFIGTQEGAQKMFAMLGFVHLIRLENYVQDMQTVTHDYVLMGLDMQTDEEYAGMG